MNYNNDNINNNQQVKLMDFSISEKSSIDFNENCDNNVNDLLKDLQDVKFPETKKKENNEKEEEKNKELEKIKKLR